MEPRTTTDRPVALTVLSDADVTTLELPAAWPVQHARGVVERPATAADRRRFSIYSRTGLRLLTLDYHESVVDADTPGILYDWLNQKDPNPLTAERAG
jgi:hypothetical protein